MGTATFGQQTKALVQKSWTFQKRNIGSNICLCVAPIFFCVLLAVIQVLINRLFLSSAELKCGCYCEQCCPEWALTSSPGNYTSDGSGTITVLNPASFGGYSAMALLFGPRQMVNNTDGSVTVQTCGPVGSGACPGDLGYTCLKTDDSKCGIQFSTPSQSQWCAVPQPSVWPGVVQSVDQDERALPWGATNVNGTTVNRTATLITGTTPSLVGQVSSGLYTGNISSDINLWKQALLGPNGLYTGNATDPDQGNIYNGDWLSQLGLQFGTNSDAQINIYFERAFQPGQNLYVMMPVNLCVSKGITTSSSMCLSDFLKLYFANSPTVNSTLLSLLPPCTGGRLAGQSSNQLLPTLYLQVFCTENAIVPMTNTATLENTLYCGFYQSRCNGTTWENQKYQGAYDLQNSSATGLNIQVYYNQSADLPANGAPPRLLRLPGPINNAVSAWWSTLSASSSGSIELLGVMSMPKQSSQLTLDFSSLLGPLFFTWVVQLLLPTFLQQLVYEKEKRLRMMMKMHGLGDVVYWLVTYLWYLILYIVYIIIFIVIGAIVRLNMFRKTNLGIQIIFYFLQGNCMIAFAFMLSSLFTSARTAVMVAFLYVFGSGLIAELLLQPFMADNQLWTFFVEWIPAFALYRGLLEMSAYSQVAVYRDQPGMQFSNLSDSGNGMLATWGIFVVEWALFLVIGIYLEQVVSSGTGIRRHPLYFINWMWKKKGNPLVDADGDHRTSLDGKMAALQQIASTPHTVSMGGTVRDVEVERMRVEGLTDTSDTPILVKDLKKVYPGLDGGAPKTAVRSMTLGVSRGECFGLLGPNGAGKTSFINMLVGFLEPTAGSAVIEGFDLRSEMQNVYKLMGVCPQHDLLWEELSGREHLRFYGRLKGLNGSELEEAIDAALKSVSLFSAGVGDKFAGKYSGGMKRRLSVAISFIGSPKVVYLDEPSTGLDPASRRNLWDVVRTNKDGRSIILTTHSMEEAEMLCDRLGIFVDGQLVCIGNPKEITSRYAGFFVFTISVPAHQEEAARQLVASMSPNAVLTYELGGTLKYELPTSDVTLSQVFARVNAAKDKLDIIDWGIANATLEEVFIKLAKSIGAQSKDS